MPTIRPGDVFFDRLDDGRYEKCILQPTTGEEPDRMAAARGGTGEFYTAIPQDVTDPARLDAADEMIMDIVPGDPLPKFVFLERIK